MAIPDKKPMPKKRESALKRVKTPVIKDPSKVEGEDDLESEIAEEGEIMELANPEDEREDFGDDSEED